MNGPALAAFLLGIAAALAYLPLLPRPAGALRSALKTAPVALLALAALLSGASPLLVAALALSAAGDLALSRRGRMAFLYGLAAFALAHLLYGLLFLGLSGGRIGDAFVLAPLPALAMLALALSTEIWLAPHLGGLRWPVRAYVVLIGVMMLTALTLGPARRLASFGAALFVLSDLILALERFRLQDGPWRRRAALAVWLLYVAGQAAIVIGAGAG